MKKTKKIIGISFQLFVFCFTILIFNNCSTPENTSRTTSLRQTEIQNIDYNQCWVAVASTGAVDHRSRDYVLLGERLPLDYIGTDPSYIQYFGGAAYLRGNSPKDVYHIRYPIHQRFVYKQNIAPEFQSKISAELSCRYSVKDKSKSRVLIKLNRYKLRGSLVHERVETLLALDSDYYAENPSFESRTVSIESIDFDFKNYGYFIDAQLIVKEANDYLSPTLENSGPSIGLIQICPYIQID